MQTTSSVTGRAGQYASAHGWANDRVYALIQLMAQDNKTAKMIDGVLDTGMYLAAQAVLDAAAVPYGESPNQIWRAEGLAVRTPVVSLPALIVVSVLMALQVVGLLLLLWYIYKVPTWTETLDAMALAMFVGQWSQRDGGLFRGDGLWELTPEQQEVMEITDALVGVERPAGEGPEGKRDYLLGVGGPGAVTRRLYKPGKGDGAAVELDNLA